MFCENCGKAIPDTAAACPHCGRPTAPALPPPRRKAGLGVLAVTRTILRSLSEGKVIRSSMAAVLVVVAGLTLVGGLFVLIEILKFSFQLPSAAGTAGGLALALLVTAALFADSQIFLFRAQSIRELEDSPSTVIPILSILLRAVGEAYAVCALAVGVGGCLFIWLSGMNPASMLAEFAGVIPGMPAAGGTFLDGLIFLGTLALGGLISLVLFYALAEMVVVVVDIAVNIRSLSKRGVAASV